MCEWPSAVAILEDDETPVMCSGSLIAPDIVLTAAHCLNPERPIVAIGFGEAGQVFGEPAFTVAPDECVAHPDYTGFGYTDIAYCRLSEPVTEVPIVPLLAGCEIDVLQPGQTVTIVGFGATWGTYDPKTDAVLSMGVGAKRYTTQTIDFVDPEIVEVNMLGPNGSQSACFGDSGGPALVELDDGTWRVFGAGSHLYDPGGLPAPIEPDNICGAGVAYANASAVIDWLESDSGVDLTPCWDGDEYVLGCGGQPMTPGVASGTWKTSCVGGELGGGAAVCEPATGESGGESSSSGDSSSEDSGADDSSSGVASVTATDGDTADGTDPTAGDDTGIGAESTEGTGGAAQDDDGGGCGCRSGADDRALPITMLAIGALVRRRQRRAR